MARKSKRLLALVLTLVMAVGLMSVSAGALSTFDEFFADISDNITATQSGTPGWIVSSDGEWLTGASSYSYNATDTITLTAANAGTLSFDYYMSTYGLPTSSSSYYMYCAINGTKGTQWASTGSAAVYQGTETVHVEAGDEVTIVLVRYYPASSYNGKVKNFQFESDCPHTGKESAADYEYLAPSCTTDGYERFTCPLCGSYINKTLSATGHKGVLTNETSTYWEYTCSECSEVYQTEKDARCAAMTLTGVNATFEDTGSYPWEYDSANNRLQSTNKGINSSTSATTITLSAANAFTLSFDYAASSESKYDKMTITVDSTTVADAISGTTTGSYPATTLPAGEHTISLSFTKDSSSAGNDDRGYISNISAVINCDHTSTSSMTVPATCTAPQTTTVTCDDCGAVLSVTTSGEALGHDITGHTCNNDGATHTFTCSRCDGGIEDCTWAENDNYTAPTCGVPGSQGYTCTVCGGTKTAEIAATGEHTFVDGVCTECGALQQWDGTSSAEPATNAEGVYQIGSGEELKWFADYINAASANGSACAELTDDIDLGGHEWAPIGTNSSYAFKGNFDGNGHTISGLYINKTVSSSTYVGFFGYTNAATIHDFVLQGSVACTAGTTSSAYVGGVVGGATTGTTITNVGSEVSVSATTGATSASYYAYCGGIVGYVSGQTYINQSYNKGAVTASCTSAYGGTCAAGGIAGYAGSYLNLTDVYNAGTISSTNGAKLYAGGIIAYSYTKTCTLASCYNAGAVSTATGYTATYSGAIVGYCYSTTYITINAATPCYYLDNVSATSGYNVISSTLAISKTSDELKALASTLGSSWANDNASPANQGYPILTWQVTQSAHTHSYTATVTAPDCTSQGYTTYTCECGDSYVGDYADATGHTPAEAVVENTVAASCEAAGSYDSVVYCSVCGDELSRETIIVPATGHSFENGICTECGEEEPGFAVTLTASGVNAVVTGITSGGRYDGETAFTVTSPVSCVVAVKNVDGDGNVTYTKLTAAKAEGENAYSFTVNITAGTEIVIAAMGDANGDGELGVADVLGMAKRATALAVPTGLQALTLDIDGDGKLTVFDVMTVLAAALGRATLAW